jgi:two-component system, LytTR family, sensor kinase
MGNTVRHNLRRYAIYFLAWTALGVFYSTQGLTQKRFSNDPTPSWHYLASWLTSVYIWAFLTPFILRAGRRFPFERRNWLRRTSLHLLFSVCFAIIQLSLHGAVLPQLGVFPSVMNGFSSAFLFLLIIGFHPNIVTYFMILGIQSGFRYYRQYQEREREALRLELLGAELQSQLMRAQLGALKMQLQPHFLFNTLNAIMSLVRQRKGEQAEEMLARLSDLLRCVLEDVEAQEVPLRRELEYLRLYLYIEQARFQDRLKVEISADPAILDAALPQMGLQPIVENAIRHGIGRSSAAGLIRIGASRVNDRLELRVQDDGPGFPVVNSSPDSGIGLSNTKERLRQLYGAEANLKIENGQQGGAVVTMTLPYHVAPGNPEMEVLEIHAIDHADR